MNKTFTIRVVTVIAAVLLCSVPINAEEKPITRDAAPHLKYVAEFDGGILYKADVFNVIELHGNYHQMGRQYGKLLKDDLKKFYDGAVKKFLIGREGLTSEEMVVRARSVFDIYPQRFKAILHGMEETSGIELDKLMILDQIVAFPSIENRHFCSFMATWGNYTSGKSLVIGRNWDFAPSFKEFVPYLTVAVYNPDDSSIPTASIGYVGQINTFTAINEAGLVLATNEGVASGGRVFHDNRISPLILNMAFLFDSFTMKQLDAAMNTARTGFPFIVNIADRNAAYSYEWPTFGIKKRSGVHGGLLVATDHFVDSSWGIVKPNRGMADDSVTRRNNLLALADKYKGTFNSAVMKTVLDTSIEKGGATWAVETYKTTYQIIAIPEHLKLWLKSPGFRDWTEIDLSMLFRN